MSDPRSFITKDWDGFPDHHPMKVVKRRIPIEAFQLPHAVIVETLEGNMKAEPGDFLAKGIRGEYYPIRKDIFLESYEPYDAADSAVLKMPREIFNFLKACADKRRAIDEYGIVYLTDPEAQGVADMYSNLDKVEVKTWEACKEIVAELMSI